MTLVPGSDMVLPLARLAAETGTPIALLGSTEDTLAAAAAGLTAQVPGLEVAGRFAPPIPFDPESPEADALLDEVAASGAKLVFLALGAPKQEILAARGRTRTPDLGFASIRRRARLHRRQPDPRARLGAQTGAGMGLADGHEPPAPRRTLRPLRPDPARPCPGGAEAAPRLVRFREPGHVPAQMTGQGHIP